MSEQDGAQSSIKKRKSRKTNTANQQNGKQTPAAQGSVNDEREAWKTYWEAQGQPWRNAPEIDLERQKYLDERRSIKPDIEQGIYPFKDIKLSRADVEWLLATHENGRGPVHIREERQYSGFYANRVRGKLLPKVFALFKQNYERAKLHLLSLRSWWRKQIERFTKLDPLVCSMCFVPLELISIVYTTGNYP